MIIAFEGVDGCGKKTQLHLLEESLKSNGISVCVTREPGGTKTGEAVRRILLDNENPLDPLTSLFLFNATRRQWCCEVVQPALRRGEVVLTDRSHLSSIVYQGHAEGLPLGTVRRICRLAVHGFPPDIFLVLDLPTEIAWARLRQANVLNRYGQKTKEFHEKVRQGYLLEARHDDRIRVVDATRSVEEIRKAILAALPLSRILPLEFGRPI